ncbi:glycerol dehydrogenase [Pelagibaculum spongiae]|uniref:Glycerol dehydrogenase n=1 Tax=Pelagibaculum spongiae TaxID=2080658 RepID=A0A2V1GZA9_9GAMM|nr:glycerol dehydrogenase [Pelagibaculum spongiae]PVZ70294.1 glycerol dehydrogenase [Pelagibaculum spongiae]
MLATAIFPGRYVQGDNALSALGEEAARQGHRALIIADSWVHLHLMPEISEGLSDYMPWLVETFSGECSDEEIDRLVIQAEDADCDVIIGIGGGKTLDTAKVVAFMHGCRLVVVPTLASNDSPCSSLSIIYYKDGRFKRYLQLPRNPDAVIVDTGVIARAPLRSLVAGMGDALATLYETEDCRQSGKSNQAGRRPPLIATAIAKLCHETLMEWGELAVDAAKIQVVTPALEHIVETNILLSGLGYESGGLAAAHAIGNGLTALPQTRQSMHGEKVAFGVQAMMFLTGRSRDEIDRVYSFCHRIKLPMTLESLGLADPSTTELQMIAEAACSKGESMDHEPFAVSVKQVIDALKMADSEGRKWLKK